MSSDHNKHDATMPPDQLHERLAFLTEVRAWCESHKFLKGASDWLPYGNSRIEQLLKLKGQS